MAKGEKLMLLVTSKYCEGVYHQVQEELSQLGRVILPKTWVLNVLAKFLTASERFRCNSKALDWYLPTRMNSEINFLGRLSHPNLVRLLGYCWESKELLPGYEFMQKGSSENHLFRRNPAIKLLSWDKRLQISVGAARGLAFLHTSDRKVIYRDFKASNILLDGMYNTKILDRIMGTYAYAAPEYIATDHLYVKSDIYGFGVVLLELLTGLRALDAKLPSGQHNLVD